MFATSASLTILLPTYNRLSYLKQCLESLEVQKDKDFVLIISNNGSTDGTKEWLDEWSETTTLKVRVNHNIKNFGPLYNADMLLSLAKKNQSNWLTILCDDDLVENNFVEIFKDVLSHTKASLVACNLKVIDKDGAVTRKSNNKRMYLKPEDVLINFFRKAIPIETAGISGFCFKSDNFMGFAKFPKGYHDDTWIVAEQSSFSGIETIEEYLYFRRLWSGAESGMVYSSLREFIKISYADYLFRNRLVLLCERILSLHPDVDVKVANAIRGYSRLYKKHNFATDFVKHKIKKLFRVASEFICKRYP